MGVKILIVNDDMSESEKKEILRLIKKLSSQRRRDRKPRLKYVIDFKNQ